MFFGVFVFTSLTLFTSYPVVHERVTTTVTWDREISAIVRTRCVSCHRDGGKAPMSLATYAQARPWARAIRNEVVTRRMPVWHAARGYGDFSNDPSLSPFEIALIVAWVDGGAPRSFVPRGMPAPRLPGPPEAPLVPGSQPGPALPDARAVELPCGDQPAPAGRLIGVRPEIGDGASVRVTMALPNGRQEILGWFRDFNSKFAPTYWLRTPLQVPQGARIASVVEDGGTTGCRVTLVLERRSAG